MSISLLASYIFLGITLAAPIGPVNSAEIDKGIKYGFFHAWMVGGGAVIADAFFMLLGLFRAYMFFRYFLTGFIM